MMQPMFRVILIIVSLATMAYMMRKIRQAKVQIEAAMFWVMLALLLVVFAICPPVANICARLLGIYSTPNFLFLFTIFRLMAKVFSMTIHPVPGREQAEGADPERRWTRRRRRAGAEGAGADGREDRAAEVEDECEQ